MYPWIWVGEWICCKNIGTKLTVNNKMYNKLYIGTKLTVGDKLKISGKN